jgi:PAX-interacting protein 1
MSYTLTGNFLLSRFSPVPAELCLLGGVFHVVGYDWVDPKVMAKYVEKVKRYGGEVSSTYEPRVNHVVSDDYRRPEVDQAIKDGKRVVTLQWLNDVISVKKKATAPWEALHIPPQYTLVKEKPLKKLCLSVAGFCGPEREKVRRMIDVTGAKYTGVFSKHNHFLVCKK